VGSDYPVWCRLDAHEFRVDGGITLEDAKQHARFAEEAGADAIHVSAYSDGTSGIGFTEGPLVHASGGYADFAAEIKRSVHVPVIAVGRIDPERANRMIEGRDADFVAMGRRLIADPELPNKIAAGRLDEVRPCINCYRCVGEVCVGRSVRCTVNPLAGREGIPAAPESPRPRHVVVLGGGPSGMEAARVAATTGHRVTLLERRPRLGGCLVPSPPFDSELGLLTTWLETQLERAGVDIRCGTEATPDRVAALAPDAIVVATGRAEGSPETWVELLPDAAGSLPRLLDTATLPARLETGPERITVVLGANGIAIRIAEWLSAAGTELLILEKGDEVAAELAVPARWRSMHLLRERGARIVTGVLSCRWDGEQLEYRRSGSGVEGVCSSVVIDARPTVPDVPSEAGYREICGDVRCIGDARGHHTLEDAIRGGFETGRALGVRPGPAGDHENGVPSR